MASIAENKVTRPVQRPGMQFQTFSTRLGLVKIQAERFCFTEKAWQSHKNEGSNFLAGHYQFCPFLI